MAQARVLRLILGDQLNSHHSWFQRVQPNVTYVLMEIRQETNYVKHHIQKAVGFFAAMRSFAQLLSKCGHKVAYLCLNDTSNCQNFEDNIRQIETPCNISFFKSKDQIVHIHF